MREFCVSFYCYRFSLSPTSLELHSQWSWSDDAIATQSQPTSLYYPPISASLRAPVASKDAIFHSVPCGRAAGISPPLGGPLRTMPLNGGVPRNEGVPLRNTRVSRQSSCVLPRPRQRVDCEGGTPLAPYCAPPGWVQGDACYS